MQAGQRLLQTFTIVLLRRVVIAQLFVKLRAGKIGVVGWLHRQTRIQIIARLAPQFFARAEASQRE